jgi:hypothetical protein
MKNYKNKFKTKILTLIIVISLTIWYLIQPLALLKIFVPWFFALVFFILWRFERRRKQKEKNNNINRVKRYK